MLVQSSSNCVSRKNVPLALLLFYLAAFLSICPSAHIVAATLYPVHHHLKPAFALAAPSIKASGGKPLKITNLCAEMVHPGIMTQSGGAPPSSGFALSTGNSKTLTVSADWQGRVWGRTNCSFNPSGTGASNNGGLNGGGKACMTGDCNGIVDCRVSGDTPVTLAEFTLAASTGQTFYDISLVDGYNLPMAIVLLDAGDSDIADIPPNLTNPVCIATAGLLAGADYNPYTSLATSHLGTNGSYPLPFDQSSTDADLSRWCPWNLQQSPPSKPGDGVYPYPDDNIQRPSFNPCFSACAKNNQPGDCCTAFDDQTSTFIIPEGGGFEVVFCPGGRSTNILATMSAQLFALASGGDVRAGAVHNSSSQKPNKARISLPRRHVAGLWAYAAAVAFAVGGV
ncbi:MAG: hypothetical protein M1833_001999 [Piccolia ochrophora]|nr:MAG: hypothetical protein M1833_001999 [Piccolia ochrophora]